MFKKDTSDNWISDGGITFGYGYYVSKNEYEIVDREKALVDKYAPVAPILPTVIPENGRAYQVPGSLYMSIEEARQFLREDFVTAETAVNNFLSQHQIQLSQNQFDVLVSFTYNYGTEWWNKDKVMPNFIRIGKGTYDSGKVRRIFLMHDNPDRRAVEADVFINGY